MTTPLRVVVDGRPLVGDRTGIGVHTAEIAARLDTEPKPLIASHAEIVNRRGIEHLRFAVDPTTLGVIWQQTVLPAVARREHADVVWGPHGTLPLGLRTPAVVSVHDLTSITMPHRHRVRTLLSFNLLIAGSLARAKHVAAVSRLAADEIMRGFAVPARKISVVPNGVDEFYSPLRAEEEDEALPARITGKDYILFVGTIEPRKGIIDLLEAWRALGAHRPRLVLCGSSGWKNERLLQRIEPDIEHGSIILTGYVPRTVLRALYRHAMIFVYPSHFEGFGLPPLEAMACGVPVVASRGGAIPEVTGNAAALFTPGDVEALTSHLRTLISDSSSRRELAAKGTARAAEFRWDRSAELMREILLTAAD